MNLILDTYTHKYETILKQRPSLKMYDLKKRSVEKDIKIAKSNYYPSLNLSANVGSGYSNLRYDYINEPNTQQLIKGGKMSFSDQYSLNLSKSWGLSLNIPIFSKFQNKTAVSNARIQLKDIEIQQQIEHNRLYKQLQQAYTNALVSIKKYEVQQKTVISLKEAFHYAQERYELGMLSNFEYNEALSSLTNAQSNMLQAKYEYLFRMKILEFYGGKPLKF